MVAVGDAVGDGDAVGEVGTSGDGVGVSAASESEGGVAVGVGDAVRDGVADGEAVGVTVPVGRIPPYGVAVGRAYGSRVTAAVGRPATVAPTNGRGVTGIGVGAGAGGCSPQADSSAPHVNATAAIQRRNGPRGGGTGRRRRGVPGIAVGKAVTSSFSSRGMCADDGRLPGTTDASVPGRAYRLLERATHREDDNPQKGEADPQGQHRDDEGGRVPVLEGQHHQRRDDDEKPGGESGTTSLRVQRASLPPSPTRVKRECTSPMPDVSGMCRRG